MAGSWTRMLNRKKGKNARGALYRHKNVRGKT